MRNETERQHDTTGDKTIGFFLNSEKQTWYPNGRIPDNVPTGNRPVNAVYEQRKILWGVLGVAACGLFVATLPSAIPVLLKFAYGAAAFNAGAQFSNEREKDRLEHADIGQNWLYSHAERVMGEERLKGLEHDQWQEATKGALREKLAELGFNQEDRDLLVDQAHLSSLEQARLDGTFAKAIAKGGQDDLLNLLAAHRKALADTEETAKPKTAAPGKTA